MQPAQPLDGGLDVIFLAGRDATRCDDQIMPGARGDESVGESGLAVRANPEIGHGATQFAQQGCEHETVGVVDHAGRQRGPRFANFIAGGEQCHAQPAKNQKLAVSERSGETEISGRQPPSGSERYRPLGDILSSKTPVRSLFDPWPQPYLPVFDAAVLLHHYRVGTIRHRSAGKDPDRSAPPGGLLGVRSAWAKA